ncbi:MAG: hypothetical protein KGM47_17695 [Acidobacteriota bacterium]|nr:hypothetical protein [Acidobacteriota bacterium]
MRSVARILVVAFLASLAAPVLRCAAAPASSQQMMECCRGMKNLCHKARYDESCCLNQPPVTFQSAFLPAPKVKAPPLSLALVALLHPVTTTTHGRTAGSRFTAGAEGDSPPSSVSLHILHSIWLI